MEETQGPFLHQDIIVQAAVRAALEEEAVAKQAQAIVRPMMLAPGNGPKAIEVHFLDRDVRHFRSQDFVCLDGAVWLRGLLGPGNTVTDKDVLIPFSAIKEIYVT